MNAEHRERLTALVQQVPHLGENLLGNTELHADVCLRCKFEAALAASLTEKPAGPHIPLIDRHGTFTSPDFPCPYCDKPVYICRSGGGKSTATARSIGVFHTASNSSHCELAEPAPSGESGTSAPARMLTHCSTPMGCAACDLTDDEHVEGKQIPDPRPPIAAPGQGEARTADEIVKLAIMKAASHAKPHHHEYEDGTGEYIDASRCAFRIANEISKLATGNSESGAQMEAATPAPERAADAVSKHAKL